MGAGGESVRPAPAAGFVGRDGELSVLHAALRRASAGRPGMVLVAGEAGVGKSGWLASSPGRPPGRGTLVAVGGAAPLTGGALPYAPLLQALRALADDHEPAALGGQGEELAGVLAELAGDRPAASRAGARGGPGAAVRSAVPSARPAGPGRWDAAGAGGPALGR